MKSIIDACMAIITFILTLAVIIYFINDYRKGTLSSIKEYINKNLGNMLFTFGLLFSFFGLILMIGTIIEFVCGLIKNQSGVYDGFAVLVFGVSLFSMAGSIHQTRKNNEENIQFKNDINSKLESLNPSNVDLHDEIEKLKEQNQEIIVLLKEKNQTNVHIYVNEEDKSKKTRKNGEYKK